MNESINQSVTKVFVEQPLASPGSAKYNKVFPALVLLMIELFTELDPRPILSLSCVSFE